MASPLPINSGKGVSVVCYKGKLNKDGTAIAVKLLSSESKQGERQFLNELGLISNLVLWYMKTSLNCTVVASKMATGCWSTNTRRTTALLKPLDMTHVSTRVAGTIVYLAPEYAILGQLTRRADVYSFGVLLLEIVTVKCNTEMPLPTVDDFHFLHRKAIN